MENLSKFYIDGRWQDPISTGTMPVLNPATEMQEGTVATVPSCISVAGFNTGIVPVEIGSCQRPSI